MTDDAPRISDAEARELIRAIQVSDLSLTSATKFALAAFLRARVPEERDSPHSDDFSYGQEIGFNACRAQVLKGREDGK